MQDLCFVLQSLWVHMSFDQLIQMELFSWCPPFPLALTLFATGFSEPWGEGFNRDILFSTESSRVSHYCLAEGLCVSSHLLQEEAPLMVAEGQGQGQGQRSMSTAEYNQDSLFCYFPLIVLQIPELSILRFLVTKATLGPDFISLSGT